jgi:hypothetical protein
VPLPLALSCSLPVATLLCNPFVLRDQDQVSYLILSYLAYPKAESALGLIRLSLATRTHLQREENICWVEPSDL